MRGLVNFIRSLSGLTFWLLVIILSAIAIFLIMAALQIVQFRWMKWIRF